ncbi:MAG TPA: class I SAM-dependent methyltransferase, partial [Micromonosporaceae bacterium]
MTWEDEYVGANDVKHVPISPAMRNYLLHSSTRIDPVVASLLERTAALGDASGMMVPAEQSVLLTMLARMLGARKVIDIGTFTGLSALAFARGLVPGGQVISCDVTDQWLGIAREHWQRAGVADRIDFRRGSASRTLQALAPAADVDIVFIDADKMNYPNYYRLA